MFDEINGLPILTRLQFIACSRQHILVLLQSPVSSVNVIAEASFITVIRETAWKPIRSRRDW